MAEKKEESQGTVVDPKNGAAQPVQLEPENPPKGGDNPEGITSKDYKFLINGTEYEYTQTELIDLVSMGQDYTKKTMVMANEREEMKPYKEFIKRMNTDSVFNEAVAESVNDIVSSQNINSSGDGSDPILLAEVAGLRQQVQNMVTQGQFDVLESKYPKENIDRSAVADFMLTNKIASPEHAYIIMNNGALQQKAELKGLEAGKTDPNKVMVSPGGAGIKKESPVDVKKLSKLDKRSRATAQLSNLRE